MMKRILISSFVIFLIAMLVTGPVSAQKGKVNINGEVTAIDGNTLTIRSHKGEIFTVTAPDGFDLSSIQVGDSVLVKAVTGDGGAWLAQSIKQIGPGSGGDELGDGDRAEGKKLNSAFCTDGKQTKPHPLAAKLAQRYGVTESWVMEHFCAGYGMGAIMLALKTSELNGTDADTLLAERANGQGWGQIWQGLGLIGNQREGHSPPGLLKKPDHSFPK